MKGLESRKIILGLTGGFGSGKTTVARIFRSFGAKIIDADRIAHAIIKPANKIYKKLIHTFGRDILKGNKTIDRDKLARLIFNNKNSLKKLNKIMHPEIIGKILGRIKKTKSKIIVLDAPLLIEAGLEKFVDKLIVVNITRKKQLERISRKTSLKKADILKRIKTQSPLENKVRMADFVIDNNGTLEETKKQVVKIRRLLWKS